MKTTDQILKIKATVLYVLGQMPQGVDYIHLFKILYFAQQKHLVTYGMPLIEDTFCARKHGPVPTLTYKVLKASESGQSFEQKEMQEYLSAVKVELIDGHQMVMAIQKADMDELSKSDVLVLDECINRLSNIDAFDLSDLSHDKAWLKAKRTADRTGEDAKIPMYDIADAGGATKEMLSVIRERQWIERHIN
ncbi:MAG: SocA family protein [Bacteroidaceae bacterium]|nr:SocA family protein [Bacteroidaceae bacterium]